MTGPVSLGVRARAEWDLLNRAVSMNSVPCGGDTADLWHGDPKEQARAADLCMDCPVMALCAGYVLAAREPFGTWGGMTESDRRAMAREESEGV